MNAFAEKQTRLQGAHPQHSIDLAALLKAAADPLRLEILHVLTQNSYGVSELAGIFNVRQSGMSHHLKLLTTAGFTNTRREGNTIYYKRAILTQQTPYGELQKKLFKSVDKLTPHENVTKQCQAIDKSRAKDSQHFFAENAHKFREQQDLIASHSIYSEQVTQLLKNTPLKNHNLVLEVGPGQGEFLPTLSKYFNQVVALDNAPEMLNFSKKVAAEKNLLNIEFILGDTKSLTQHSILADCIVMNMVLHHTPAPADIFKHLSRALAPGGTLLVTDLCRHEQEWVKQSCGDLWQGFEPEDFTLWAQDATLEEGQSMYIALRNGFQIQCREFIKNI